MGLIGWEGELTQGFFFFKPTVVSILIKTAVWAQSRWCHILPLAVLQRSLCKGSSIIVFSLMWLPQVLHLPIPPLLVCSGLLLDQTNLLSIYLLHPWVPISKLRIVKAIPHLLAASSLVSFVLGQISKRCHKTFMSKAFLVSHQAVRIYCFHVSFLIFNSRAS